MKLQGNQIGVSDWFTVDQARIDAFADVTEDHQFIHIDPDRAAAETPFGGTIAHGFLTLSLMTHLNEQVLPKIENLEMSINYGLNKMRFLNPVRAGARIRSTISLQSVRKKSADQYLSQFGIVIEVEGEEKPALIAEQLALYVVKPAV